MFFHINTKKTLKKLLAFLKYVYSHHGKRGGNSRKQEV
jgi:predicted nucleotidyltransferase